MAGVKLARLIIAYCNFNWLVTSPSPQWLEGHVVLSSENLCEELSGERLALECHRREILGFTDKLRKS